MFVFVLLVRAQGRAHLVFVVPAPQAFPRQPVRELPDERFLRQTSEIAVQTFKRKRVVHPHAVRYPPAAHHAAGAADAGFAMHEHGLFGFVIRDLDELLHVFEGRGFHVCYGEVDHFQ